MAAGARTHCLISKKKQHFGCHMGICHPDVRSLEEQWGGSSSSIFLTPPLGPAGSPHGSFGSRSAGAELWHVGALAHGCTVKCSQEDDSSLHAVILHAVIGLPRARARRGSEVSRQQKAGAIRAWGVLLTLPLRCPVLSCL